MAEHSDEELLRMLQPLAMEFDNVPQPSAPAPPAPMDPFETMEMDIDSIVPSIEPVKADTNGVGDEPEQPEPIPEQKKDEEEMDEDPIAYEPVKPTTRTPRSTRSRPHPSSRSKASRRPEASALPNGKSPSRKSARQPREPSKSKSPQRSQVPNEEPSKSKSPERSQVPNEEAEKHNLLAFPVARAVSASSDLSAQPPVVKTPTPEPAPVEEPAKLEFEIVIRPVPREFATQYTKITPGDEIYRVLERIPTGVPGETWLSVEFEDGRIDQVSPHVDCGLVFLLVCRRKTYLEARLLGGAAVVFSSPPPSSPPLLFCAVTHLTSTLQQTSFPHKLTSTSHLPFPQRPKCSFRPVLSCAFLFPTSALVSFTFELSIFTLHNRQRNAHLITIPAPSVLPCLGKRV